MRSFRRGFNRQPSLGHEEQAGDAQMERYETITLAAKGPVARVRLNRPDARNALSFAMVEELLACFTALRDDPAYREVRVVVLCANGKTFCAGGDLRDLTRPAEEQRNALAKMDALLQAINQAPQVVVTRVQGAALGGGLGLVCVSDIAIAGYSASFGLPEAQLGLAPALISPYVLARLGFTRTRELMLTGMRFDYLAAHNWGLIQHYCADFELDARVRAVLRDVLRAAPGALRACKELLFTVAAGGDTLDYRVALLERLRTGEEARQGATAFLQKQPAPWVIEKFENFDDAEDA
ncbi:MAG TPA: enoyl-CoA hydratase-related protein [Ktedonobacterales bacterium]|nr:enoyl-CoA hydratase-related protein [Ktedonobacterales bacterium]